MKTKNKITLIEKESILQNNFNHTNIIRQLTNKQIKFN